MRVVAATALAALAACAPVQDQIARETARATVRPILAERFPGVPLEPATDCVIDNARAGEIITLAGSAASGRATPEAVTTVSNILTRPDTISCLIREGIPLLTGVRATAAASKDSERTDATWYS